MSNDPYLLKHKQINQQKLSYLSQNHDIKLVPQASYVYTKPTWIEYTPETNTPLHYKHNLNQLHVHFNAIVFQTKWFSKHCHYMLP